MEKVSIIVTTYNRLKQLKRGWNTILDQDLPSETELLFIDDGSTDGTREYMQRVLSVAAALRKDKLPRIDTKYIYLEHPEPRISCIPRNIGIKATTGDIIIFTEPEALQVGDTIKQLLTAMKEHPENTIVASQVWTIGEKVYKDLGKSGERYFRRPQEILDHPYAMLTDNEHPHNTKAPDSDWGITGEAHCNAGVLFATRREWLLKVGGFDESFEGHGFDDFDLFNRLAIIGHGVWKDPHIAVIHQYHDKSFYNYNIYEAADMNGKKSEANIHAGIYKVNDGENWGII